jgi:hypothetical protein
MLITPKPSAGNGQGGLKHGSILGGNFLRGWVNSQWKSTDGVSYYDVPSEHGVQNYRYTIVNDQTVLVDPRTHRIVDVIR